jgi:hypothetical protein
MEFDVVILFDSKSFYDLCKSLAGIASQVKIQCTGSKISFECVGEHNSKKVHEIMFDNSEEVDDKKKKKKKESKSESNYSIIKVEKSEGLKKNFVIENVYELKNLLHFCSFKTVCTVVYFYIRADNPLGLVYPVMDNSQLSLFINPVLNNDDNYDDDEDDIEEEDEDDEDYV